MRSFEEFYTEMEQRPGIGGAVAPSMGTTSSAHEEIIQAKIAQYVKQGMSEDEARARAMAELASGMKTQPKPGIDTGKIMQGIPR